MSGLLVEDGESDLRCLAVQPVYRDLGDRSDDIVGYVFSVVNWKKYLVNLGTEDVVVVLRNSCGQSITYQYEFARNKVSRKMPTKPYILDQLDHRV